MKVLLFVIVLGALSSCNSSSREMSGTDSFTLENNTKNYVGKVKASSFDFAVADSILSACLSYDGERVISTNRAKFFIHEMTTGMLLSEGGIPNSLLTCDEVDVIPSVDGWGIVFHHSRDWYENADNRKLFVAIIQGLKLIRIDTLFANEPNILEEDFRLGYFSETVNYYYFQTKFNSVIKASKESFRVDTPIQNAVLDMDNADVYQITGSTGKNGYDMSKNGTVVFSTNCFPSAFDDSSVYTYSIRRNEVCTRTHTYMCISPLSFANQGLCIYENVGAHPTAVYANGFYHFDRNSNRLRKYDVQPCTGHIARTCL